MSHYVLHTPEGVIRQVLMLPQESPEPSVEGLVTLVVSEHVDGTRSHVANGGIVAGLLDLRTLQQHKTDAWGDIKAERERRMVGTFEHAGNTYDIDPVNLSGASIDAREALIAGEPWTQMWVLANNSVITLTALEMIALARTAKAEVSNLWGTSQYLRGLVEAATTIEQVKVITWP